MSDRRPGFVVFQALVIGLCVLGSACGDGDGASSMRTVVVSTEDLQQWQSEAKEVADTYWGAWPDTAAIEARLADDVVFYDPSNGDFVIEGGVVGGLLTSFVDYYADAEPLVETMFLSADAAAYRFSSGMWPPWRAEPSDHPPFVFLDVFRFEDDFITHYEVWMEAEAAEMTENGCFAMEGCPEAQELVDRYVAAWMSEDPDQIAALYADEAAFTDSLFGIAAAGPEEIGGLAEERFGSGDLTFEVLGVYGQTNGYHPATAESPESGRIIGVGIHYRVLAADGSAPIVESLTTFELGTRKGESFDRHPHGLITREEVFHHPEALTDPAA